jgi:hypothetical protein
VEDDSWTAYEVSLGRSDVLPAFEASARSYGCAVERLGSRYESVVGGFRRDWYGVSASCDGENVAIITLAGERVRIGCARPSTRDQCDRLLERISEAR